MATVPAEITAAARGIARTLAGYVIETESISSSAQIEQTPDQNNAIAAEEVYDHRYELSLTVHSANSTRTAPAATNDQIAYADHNWVVDSIEEAGSYNGLLRFNIRAHRYDNFPAAAAAPSNTNSNNSSTPA